MTVHYIYIFTLELVIDSKDGGEDDGYIGIEVVCQGNSMMDLRSSGYNSCTVPRSLGRDRW